MSAKQREVFDGNQFKIRGEIIDARVDLIVTYSTPRGDLVKRIFNKELPISLGVSGSVLYIDLIPRTPLAHIFLSTESNSYKFDLSHSNKNGIPHFRMLPSGTLLVKKPIQLLEKRNG